MTAPLVIAIGNRYRGDDGAGPAIADEIEKRMGDAVRLTRSGGEATNILNAWEGEAKAVIIDAAAGLAPGTLHRIDGKSAELPGDGANASTHNLGLREAIELGRALDTLPGELIVYVLGGASFDKTGTLSPDVAAAIGPAADTIIAEIAGPDAA